MSALVFYPCAALALIMGFITILATNPMHSAIALITCLFSLAPLFIGFGAHFVGVIQVLVYGGAIMVLFLFVIMLMNLRKEELPVEPFSPGKAFGVLLVLFVTFLMLKGVGSPAGGVANLAENFGTVRAFGDLLIHQYFHLVIASAVLILTATVAVVSLARKEVV